MSILDKLSQEDNTWRVYALDICNDKDLADDLVQDMYLKFHRNKIIRSDKGYVYWAIRNLFIDHLRKQIKDVDLKLVENYLAADEQPMEPTQVEILVNKKLKLHNDYYAEMALMQADGKSLRKLAYLYHNKYGTIHLNISKIKDSLKFDTEVRDLYLSLNK